jgi:hypothetical protein
MASGTPNHSFTAGLRRHGLVKLSPGSGLASFVERELAFSGTPARNKDDAADNIRNTLVEAVRHQTDRERELLTCTGGTAEAGLRRPSEPPRCPSFTEHRKLEFVAEPLHITPITTRNLRMRLMTGFWVFQYDARRVECDHYGGSETCLASSGMAPTQHTSRPYTN